MTDSHLVAGLAPNQSRALFRAVHALARRTMQKERNARVHAARTFHTPPEVAAAVLANPPFAPTPAPLSPDAPPCVPEPDTNPATETEAAMIRDEHIEAIRAKVAILADFVKGIYRVAVEIRDDSRKARSLYNPAETATTPKQAALPLDDCAVLPEPGDIARKIAAAPRAWGNSVKWYEAAWREFGTRAFCLGDTFARSSLSTATNGKCGVASYQRILSALIKAGAAQRVGRSTFYIHEPTDELREAVERVRNQKGANK